MPKAAVKRGEVCLDFLIATHNLKKREELQRILAPLGVRVLLADEIGVDLIEVEETGTTFYENALLKAKGGCKDSSLACIADDSGLVVDALDGRPGVYSARYGGEDLPYPEKMAKLVAELDGVPLEKRTARFVSCVVCAFPDGTVLTAEGKCEGWIGYEPKGDNGFGFDPIFYTENGSFAELSAEQKDAISHRGNALRAFADILAEHLK